MTEGRVAVKKVTASDLRQNLRVHLKAAKANTVVLVENRRQPAKYLVDKEFLDSLMKERESILATMEIDGIRLWKYRRISIGGSPEQEHGRLRRDRHVPELGVLRC